MSPRHHDLSEIHILGAGTRQLLVRADERDARSWLQGAPVCAALAHHAVAHTGVARARAPYSIVRVMQSGTYFMGCVEGEGRILIDGRWRVCRAGMGCLLPPGILNAFRCVPGKVWEFAWVRYQAGSGARRMVSASSPVLARFEAAPLVAAVRGLHAECSGDPQLAALHHWVELIQGYVSRFARPWQMDGRLERLWDRVAGRLSEDWTLGLLAREARMSGEHLRRLCTRELGRPPMRQLTFLRMRMAAELLATTNDKIESIARSVGFMNPFVFSTTFKKWIGWRPSDHRQGLLKIS